MSIKTFIDRPVLSCVLSVFIVLLGVIGLSRLPMEQFPDMAPPTVRVSATRKHESRGDIGNRHIKAEFTYRDTEGGAHGIIENTGTAEDEANVDAHDQAATEYNHEAVVNL